MPRTPAHRPTLIQCSFLPEPFRSCPGLLSSGPWHARSGIRALPGLRRHSSPLACTQARHAGRDAFLATLATLPPGVASDPPAPLPFLPWRPLFVPLPAAPWEAAPGTDEPITAPLLIELSWRYGWIEGVFQSIVRCSPHAMRHIYAPWRISGKDELELPAAHPPSILSPCRLKDPKFNKAEIVSYLTKPWWPTYVRRELNCHDSAGNRIAATHYWPDASKIKSG